MPTKTFETSATPRVRIEADAELSLIGWDRSQLHASCDNDQTEMNPEPDGAILVRLHSECTLFVPYGSIVKAAVGGDLRVENVAKLEATVGGDLSARDVSALAGANVGGDLSARACLLVAGERNFAAGGDANVKLSEQNEPINLSAGGDIHIDVTNRSNLSLRLMSSSGVREFAIGSGGGLLTVTAGGEIYVNGAPGHENSEGAYRPFAFDFGNVLSHMDGWIKAENLDGMARDLSEKLRVKFEHRFNKVRERAERHTERAAERARREVERAQRNAERAIHQGAKWATSWGTDRQDPNVTQAQRQGQTVTATPKQEQTSEPRGARVERAPAEPVGDQERLMILKMVEEKKITVEQADQLLRSLEQ